MATSTYTGPVPGAGGFGLLKAQADAAYQSALSQIGQQRGSFLSGQGLTGQYDASGNYTGFSVDGHNTTGGYQQMEQANAQGAQTNDAAISALGFGGGLKRQAQETAQNQYSANAASWATQALGTLGGYGTAEQSATQNYGDTLYNDLMTSIQTAIQNGTYNPADYNGISIPGYGTISGLPSAPGTPGTPGWKPPGSSGHPTNYQQYAARHSGRDDTYSQWVAAKKPRR